MTGVAWILLNPKFPGSQAKSTVLGKLSPNFWVNIWTLLNLPTVIISPPEVFLKDSYLLETQKVEQQLFLRKLLLTIGAGNPSTRVLGRGAPPQGLERLAQPSEGQEAVLRYPWEKAERILTDFSLEYRAWLCFLLSVLFMCPWAGS